VSAITNESLKHSGRNFNALVGMDSSSKADFHMTLRFHKYTQPYLDHAYDIVHDFRKCHIRVLYAIEPKEGGAVQEDKDKKDCKPDPTEKRVEIGSPPSITTDTRSNQMVTGFQPTPDGFVYVEKDCIKYVHASGPLDIGCDFEAVDELIVHSNITRSSFQYTDYFGLIHNFSEFFEKWLTVDTVQFYQCWVSRSIGSYPKNIFLFPLDYYQATVEDVFEKYWNGIQPTFKKEFVKRMWRYVHPASYLRYKINIRKKKSKKQSEGSNCGVYTSLSWLMFVAVEQTKPGLWTKIGTFAGLDKEIAKPFWDLHENKNDRMINFRYRICRLMEFFLDKRIEKKNVA
jgi:hypothetical protein